MAVIQVLPWRSPNAPLSPSLFVFFGLHQSINPSFHSLPLARIPMAAVSPLAGCNTALGGRRSSCLPPLVVCRAGVLRRPRPTRIRFRPTLVCIRSDATSVSSSSSSSSSPTIFAMIIKLFVSWIAMPCFCSFGFGLCLSLGSFELLWFFGTTYSAKTLESSIIMRLEMKKEEQDEGEKKEELG